MEDLFNNSTNLYSRQVFSNYKQSDTSTTLCFCYCFPDFRQIWTELRRNQELCDGTVVTGDGQIFKVHRAILAAVSPYFKTLFTTTLNDGKETKEVVAQNVNSELMEILLEYAYTGALEVTPNNVEKLLPIADQYGVLGAVNVCCQFLRKELRSDNCVGIFKFSKAYACSELTNEASKFILSRFKDVCKESSEIYDLPEDELYNFLRQDELNIRHEELLLEPITKWVEKNLPGRKAHLPKLLSTIRFGLTTPAFLDQVKRISYVQNDPKCHSLLEKAVALFRFQADYDCNDLLIIPRTPHEILFAIGGWSAGSPTNFVETYDTRADRWFLSVDTDQHPRAYHGVCTLGHVIYMIGGYNGNEHFNSVRCFDPVSRTWTEKACMYHARCYVSVSTMSGLIYAMGGFNGRVRLSSCERYNPDKNQWEMIASMNRQRSDASATSLNNRMYIAGGFNGQEVLDSAEVYDPVTNQWTVIVAMNSPRSGVSLITYRNSIYALGGFNGYTRLNTGERLKPNHSDPFWYEIPEMFNPRSNFAAVILDDMIFVVGGFNGSATIPYVECYDGESKEWFDASPMNLNRSALSAVVVADLPNAADYSYSRKIVRCGAESGENNLN